MSIGEKIKCRRHELDMTLEDVSTFVGVSRQTLSRYETGVIGNIPSDKIELLAQVLKISPSYLMGWDDIKIDNADCLSCLENDSITFPVIGSIAAGYDGQAIEEETGETLQVPKAMLHGQPPEEYMVLRVHGNSMAPLLLDGDKAIVKRCTSVDSGSIAVIIYNGSEATVKKVKYINGENWLEMVPVNPAYPVKRIENEDLEQCRVLGKVVDLIRHFD